MEKYCPDCGCDQPIEHFAFKNKAKGTRQAYCHIHRRLRAKTKYQRTRKSVIAQVRQRQSKNKNDFEHWKATLSCVVCDESNPACLDFHHYKHNKEIEVSTLKVQGYTLERIMQEARKCVVVCANCHRKVHNNDVVITREHIDKSKRLYNAPTDGSRR